jgi:hypothetical protein
LTISYPLSHAFFLFSGEAEAILLRAQASAESIRRIASAIRETPGGIDAVTLTVAEKYVEAFGQLAKAGNSVIVPAGVSDAGSMIAQASNRRKHMVETAYT